MPMNVHECGIKGPQQDENNIEEVKSGYSDLDISSQAGMKGSD